MEIELRYSKSYLIVGIIALIASLGLLIVLITGYDIEDIGELFSVIGMFLAFLIGGLYLLFQYIFYRIYLDIEFISIKNIHRNLIKHKWEDIISVKQNKARSALIITFKNEKIKIYNELNDYNTLVNVLWEKVDESKLL